MKKVICYLNQFFVGVGGEDKADQEPYIMEGVVGPGMAFKAALKGAEITHTVVCGDNFMGSHTEEALSRIMDMLQDKPCDLFIAGPAFQAGRYGVACGNVCKAVKERLHIPVITSMNEENPGVEMFKRDVIIFKGGNGAVKMRQDVKAMAAFANKLLQGLPNEGALAEGYFPPGLPARKISGEYQGEYRRLPRGADAHPKDEQAALSDGAHHSRKGDGAHCTGHPGSFQGGGSTGDYRRHCSCG